MFDLGIVIVNYNTLAYLRRCLQTVLASAGAFRFRVIVVDNASHDDSVKMVQAEFPTVEIIASATNGGFSYANNLGLQAMGFHGAGDVATDAPRYALLLNPDTEVPSNALYDMLQYMDAHPEVGCSGPKLVMENGGLDLACRRSFPTPEVSFYRFSGLSKLFPKSPRFGRYNMTFSDPDQEIEVDSVVGAYMQVRRDAIAAVGLLDETFFMYGEDLDWAFRIKQAGWKVMYHPQVVVRHYKSVVGKRSPKAQFEFQRAMLIFYRKHYQAQTSLPVHALVMLGILVKGGWSLWPEIRANPAS